MRIEDIAPDLAARLTPGDREKCMPGPDEDVTPPDDCIVLLRRLGIPSLRAATFAAEHQLSPEAASRLTDREAS